MLDGKKIVLGVTGSIAAYKAADLASKLTQAGAEVTAVMTEAATKFITPLSFSAITHQPVATDMLSADRSPDVRQPIRKDGVEHIDLAESADLVVIAPATANTIAKLAAGIADNLLTSLVLATRAPIILAPAMNVNMYQNQITQENLARLCFRGLTIVEPASGLLACGSVGQGRLADIETILGTIRQVLGRNGDLAGKHLLITAGGTQEPIDAVRHIGNRSSGKMGYALAEAARDRGAKVTLISGPSSLPTPVGIETTRQQTALQMREAVLAACPQADALIMAAAVADYQPIATTQGKIKKETAPELLLKLVRTPDILSEISGNLVKVGFAAEAEDLVANATTKLREKALDLIVANNIAAPDSGFGTDTNKVTLIDRQGNVESLPLLPKSVVADKILDRVVELLRYSFAKSKE